ncbi:hypothetical protein M758_UG323600 [Ceratodon purpureus]|nr:hypothetical protein M758_UG323600 [Ceratodon purpureus]
MHRSREESRRVRGERNQAGSKVGKGEHNTVNEGEDACTAEACSEPTATSLGNVDRPPMMQLESSYFAGDLRNGAVLGGGGVLEYHAERRGDVEVEGRAQ